MLLLRDLERHYSQSYPDMPSLRFWPREDLLRREVSVFSDRSRAIEAGRLIVSAIPEGCEIRFDVRAGYRLPMFQLWTNLSGGLFTHNALFHDAPASMRGTGKQPRAEVSIGKNSPKRLTDKDRKLVERFYAVRDTIDFPGVGTWAGLQGFSERHLHRLRTAYDRERTLTS